MPIYEYHCNKCGEFEVTQRISDDTLKRCPTCRGKVRKLISAAAFQFKGSGWYVTDYARKGNGAAKSESGGDGKGDAAPKGESAKSESPKGESSSKAADTKAA
jgi:putative FmdB family regulatory protein